MGEGGENELISVASWLHAPGDNGPSLDIMSMYRAIPPFATALIQATAKSTTNRDRNEYTPILIQVPVPGGSEWSVASRMMSPSEQPQGSGGTKEGGGSGTGILGAMVGQEEPRGSNCCGNVRRCSPILVM